MKQIAILLFCAANALASGVYATYEVAARAQSKLAFSAVGTVAYVNAELGQKVQKGQELARLNDQIERAQEAAAAANERLAASKLARAKKAAEALAKLSLEEAQAAADAAAAQLALAKAAREQKVLKAPFAGKIAGKFIELGDGVAGPQQGAFLLASEELKLLISYDVADITKVKTGDSFCFNASDDGGAARQICSKISKISPVANLQTRKLLAEANLSINSAQAQRLGIIAGTFGEGQIVK